MTNKIDVTYYRQIEVGAPILNAEKTAKKVTVSFTGDPRNPLIALETKKLSVTIKINGKELTPLNSYRDYQNRLRITHRAIPKERFTSLENLELKYNVYATDRMSGYDYCFFVKPGDTYQVISNFSPWQWSEVEYIPEVSG